MQGGDGNVGDNFRLKQVFKYLSDFEQELNQRDKILKNTSGFTVYLKSNAAQLVDHYQLYSVDRV